MSGYRRGNYRRSSTSGAGSRWMNLRYAGACKVCGKSVAAGELAFWDAAAKSVTCHSIECAKADGLTKTELVWDGTAAGKRVDAFAEQRIGDAAPADPFAKTRSRGYYGIDARRCEDAPCCGCC